MIRKLRWKFVLITMALVTVMLALIFGFILLSTQDSLRRDSLDALDKAITLTENKSQLVPGNQGGFGELLGTDNVQLPYFTVQVSSQSTAYILANQFFDTSDTETLTAIINLALESEESTGKLHYGGYSLRFYRVATIFGQRIAFVDRTQEMNTLQALTRNLVLIGLAAFGLFFAITLLLARWAVRPVEKSWKQQRQFVADASHELKTPLAVILSSTEMLQGCQDAEPEKQQRWLDNVRASSLQMKTLVEEMLVLARSDNATQQVALLPCDLSDITMDSLLLFEPIAFETGKLMEDEIEPGLTVSGDPASLKRLVDIYLDNACKYGADGSTIRVTLKSEGKHVLLGVFSAGEPLPKDQLSRIFERFYRLDASRTAEGYGLGLSIATEIAKQHHGKVWAQSSPEGNTFYFSIPKAKPEKAPGPYQT